MPKYTAPLNIQFDDGTSLEEFRTKTNAALDTLNSQWVKLLESLDTNRLASIESELAKLDQLANQVAALETVDPAIVSAMQDSITSLESKVAQLETDIQEAQNMIAVIAGTPVSPPPSVASLTVADWNDGQLMQNDVPTNYPTYFYDGGGAQEKGAVSTQAIASGQGVDGNDCISLLMTSGENLYEQFNPYTSSERFFTRDYALDGAQWVYNTYNRMRIWMKRPAGDSAFETGTGFSNLYIGTYVKTVTNADTFSDEAGGNHYYHRFNLMPGVWNQLILDWHPTHERGGSGSTEWGEKQYPTTGESPANYYNYFDCLTRWYISCSPTTPFQNNVTYYLDDIELYKETNNESVSRVYSLCGSFRSSDNTISISWNRLKNETSNTFDIKYSFSDIHSIGWGSATAAPSGTAISPDSVEVPYNICTYQTTSIDVSGQTAIYMGIKSELESTAFSQIRIPLNIG